MTIPGTITPDDEDQAVNGAAQIDAEPTDQVDQVDDTADADLDDDEPDQEARYRRRAKDAEAERDALATRLETLQRAEVERMAGIDHYLLKPAGVWAAGARLPDLLDADGNIDQAAVKVAVETAIAELGLSVRNRTPKPDRSQGARGSGPISGNPWAGVLNTRGY